MGTAIGAAIDYLVANVPHALETAGLGGVIVADGWVTDVADQMFVIGRGSPEAPQAEAGVDAIMLLGGGEVDEEFTIPCYIDTWRGGIDQAGVRADAVAAFDAFVSLLRSDRTLGGCLQGGFYAQITNHSVNQTSDPAEAAEGRRCLISFSLHCRNRY